MANITTPLKHGYFLINKARDGGTTHYKEIDREVCMGDANGTQHYLDPVAAYCKENRLPPLTALVTYKDRNKAGIGLNRWLRGQSIDEA